MAVQFILGRSGTGKTTYCIKSIVNALIEGGQQRLILLVPEQATYQAERSILADNHLEGYHRLEVLSFDRLQFMVSGRSTARAALTRLGREMIVHRLLRENSGRLRVFGPSALSTGLSRQLAGTISELHQYAKTPEDVEGLVKRLDEQGQALTGLKFRDIGLIFGEYLKAIEGRFVDPDIRVNQVCAAIGRSDFVRGAKLWVDGFSGFTLAELAILGELLKTAADVWIAFCLDGSKMDVRNPQKEPVEAGGMFTPTQETYRSVYEIVGKCRLSVAEPIVLEKTHRFSRSASLGRVEAGLFDFDAIPMRCGGDIRIVSAANVRAEVEFAAREILRLVREKGYRYRDIAVITSDMERYQHYIRAYFDDYRIPFFIDARKMLIRHPAVELICSALQVVTGGFAGSDVFSYLKTDLVPVEHEEVDLLENYCIAFGISGSNWLAGQAWEFADAGDRQFDQQRINEIREKVLRPLMSLRKRLYDDGGSARQLDAAEFTQIIFGLLEELGVREMMGQWIAEATEAGDYARADEHRQFYEKLVSLFDEMVEVFACQKQKVEDYLEILSSAFSQMAMAFIPPGLDQVLVGTIERSRHPELKAVFLIGATQRQFPVALGQSGILSDQDRVAAEGADFVLAANTTQKLIERQYLAYIAFTRPSEFLYVSYPVTDEKGGSETRSEFVGNLQSLFEDLKEESAVGGQKGDVGDILNEYELAEHLCRRLGRDRLSRGTEKSRNQLENLVEQLCSDAELSQTARNVRYAVDYKNRALLSQDTAAKLLGSRLRGSATRLSTFAQCPYRYFAKYVLGLEQRKEFKFEPIDLGSFYHKVLERLLRALKSMGRDFGTVEEELLFRLLRQQIQQLKETDPFVCHFINRSLHNNFIIESASEMLQECAGALSAMARAGSFHPVLSEARFGGARGGGEHLGDCRIGLSEHRELFLDGKIDRIDVAEVQGQKAAVVFDYKRKPTSFSWSELFYGLDIQLPMYMLAVRHVEHSPGDICGAFYIPVEVSPSKSKFEQQQEETETTNYKAKGIFNGEYAKELDGTAVKDSRFYNFYVTKEGSPYGSYGNRGALRPDDFEKVLGFTHGKIVELAEGILSGRIDILPYQLGTKSACSACNCEYRSLCRFDWQVNEYRPLVGVDKSKALEGMGSADA